MKRVDFWELSPRSPDVRASSTLFELRKVTSTEFFFPWREIGAFSQCFRFCEYTPHGQRWPERSLALFQASRVSTDRLMHLRVPLPGEADTQPHIPDLVTNFSLRPFFLLKPCSLPPRNFSICKGFRSQGSVPIFGGPSGISPSEETTPRECLLPTSFCVVERQLLWTVERRS